MSLRNVSHRPYTTCTSLWSCDQCIGQAVPTTTALRTGTSGCQGPLWSWKVLPSLAAHRPRLLHVSKAGGGTWLLLVLRCRHPCPQASPHYSPGALNLRLESWCLQPQLSHVTTVAAPWPSATTDGDPAVVLWRALGSLF